MRLWLAPPMLQALEMTDGRAPKARRTLVRAGEFAAVDRSFVDFELTSRPDLAGRGHSSRGGGCRRARSPLRVRLTACGKLDIAPLTVPACSVGQPSRTPTP